MSRLKHAGSPLKWRRRPRQTSPTMDRTAADQRARHRKGSVMEKRRSRNKLVWTQPRTIPPGMHMSSSQVGTIHNPLAATAATTTTTTQAESAAPAQNQKHEREDKPRRAEGHHHAPGRSLPSPTTAPALTSLPSWDDAALLADIYYTSDLGEDFAMAHSIEPSQEPPSTSSETSSRDSSVLLSRSYESLYTTLTQPLHLDDRDRHEAAAAAAAIDTADDKPRIGYGSAADLTYHCQDAETSESTSGSIASASTERNLSFYGKAGVALLDTEEYIDHHNFRGYNALHLAAYHGQHSLVRLLLLKSPEPALYANSINEDGQSPLHVAASRGQLEIVRELLNFGASAGSRNKKGQTALHAATAAGSLSVVQLLLDRDPSAKQMHIPDATGQTPLHRAVTQGNEEIALLLLDRGADAWSIVK